LLGFQLQQICVGETHCERETHHVAGYTKQGREDNKWVPAQPKHWMPKLIDRAEEE